MDVLKRLVRICRADLHGLLDRLEDKRLLLKHHLRDMQRLLDQEQDNCRQIAADIERLRRTKSRIQSRMDAIEVDLKPALDTENDALARILLRRLKPLADLKKALECRQSAREQEKKQMDFNLAQRRLIFERLQLRSETFLQTAEMQPEAVHEDFAFGGPNLRGPDEEEVEWLLMQRKKEVRP
jgi:phage shock protein A